MKTLKNKVKIEPCRSRGEQKEDVTFVQPVEDVAQFFFRCSFRQSILSLRRIVPVKNCNLRKDIHNFVRSHCSEMAVRS